jgi:inosine-uridine nucleoside N-ribohydrolase
LHHTDTTELMKTNPVFARGRLLRLWLPLTCLLVGTALAAPGQEAKPALPPLPVILDTDIGDDIDDTWALGFLLKSPELDLKLVVGDYGKADYRARLLAKFLQTAGRTDVAVGVGLDIQPKGEGGQAEWIKGYTLKSYPGKVHPDGVQALVDTIMQSPKPITLIAIGPLPNIAEALRREPRIAEKARFVGMHGSVRRGYDGNKTVHAEWNVKADPAACRKVFTAGWEMTITPLDTCGLVHLSGERYAKVRDSKDPVATAVIENYRLWCGKDKEKADRASSILFDTVAVYLACSQDLCTMERVGLRVTDDGFTRIDDQAKQVNAAVEWKSLDGFRDLLVTRLISPAPSRKTVQP